MAELPGPLGPRLARPRAAWRRSLGACRAIGGEAVSRGLDLVVALGLLLALAPLLLLRALRARTGAGRVLDRQPRLGRFREPFELLAFAGPWPGRSLAALLNLLRGELALVGPRALTPEEGADLPAAELLRFQARPGLVSRHGVQARTGVAYRSEGETAREQVLEQSVRGDAGLLLRSLPARLLGAGPALAAPEQFRIFGVTIANTTLDEAVDWILERARGSAAAELAFVNPDCLNLAYQRPDYRSVLQSAERVLPDGIGVHLACRVKKVALRANVNGTDLFPRLCERAASADAALYLLGARPGVAAAAAAAMQGRFPGLRVAGARDGYFSAAEEPAVVAAINASGASVLLLALGAPRQELWLRRHREALRVPVRMGVGGLFDYYSGRIPRAPSWMREIGLEWVWRLTQEPGRLWRRYVIGNPLFLWRVLGEAP